MPCLVGAFTSIILSFNSYANETAWDKFITDSSLDMSVRMSGIKLEPNNVAINHYFDPVTATGLLFSTGMNEVFFSGMTPDAVAGLLAADPATLALVTEEVNKVLEEEVQNYGEVNQGGASLWLEFESGYLFDLVGFDFGYQGGVKTWNESLGTLILKPDDDGYERISTARAKIRLGNEKRNISAKHGRGVINRMHFGRDPDEYLLDKTYEGTEISAKWDSYQLYGVSVTGIGEVTNSDIREAKDFKHYQKAGFDSTDSLGFEYKSDYAQFKMAHSWSDNYMNTTSVRANSGVPIAWLGADIADEKLLDYLLLFRIAYNWQSAEKDFVTKYGVEMPDHDSVNYEFMLGAKLDNVFFAASMNQVGEDGFYKTGMGSGGSADVLIGWSLINEFDLPNQKTYTFIVSYNGKDINLPGLDLSAAIFHSRDIDMGAVLASGNIDYYLTGDSEFTETLFEARYAIQEGALEGLSFRGVMGYESNHANLLGYALWIEYNQELF